MQREYEFFVDGYPRQSRYQVIRGPKRMKLANDVKAWKASVALQANHYMPREPIDAPVVSVLTFHLPMPPAWSGAKKERMDHRWCAVKPDCDDLEKPVIDALKAAGWFVDDSRIVVSTTKKLYVRDGFGVHVALEILDR